MTVLGTAIVKIDGDTRNLDKSFADTKQKAEGFSGSLKRMAETAGGFLLGGVVVKGVDALKSSFTSSIGLASSLAESQSKVNIVFKDSAGAISEFAKQGPKALGMSNAAALEALGTFGNFLTAMEQTPESAAHMSKSMVQLATDMGSFNNADPSEVLLALRAGLSGEAEPLKRFGVALSENAIKLEANKLGLKEVNGALTEGQKIQARYSIIMRQTASAQGDFERTSNGLANRQKILGAQIEDLKTKFGAVLLPAMTAVFGLLINVGIPALERFGGFIGSIGTKISSVLGPVIQKGALLFKAFWAAGFGGQGVTSAGMFGTFEKLGIAVQGVVVGIRKLVDLFKMGLSGGQIGGEFNTIQTAAFTLGNLFREVIIPAFNDAKEAIRLFFLVLQGGDAGGQLTGLQEKAVALGKVLRPVFDELAKSKDLMTAAAVVIGGVLVVAFGALAVSAGAAAISVIAATFPFIAVGAAVGLLALGIVKLVKHWDDITAAAPLLGQAFDAVKAVIDSVRQTISNHMTEIRVAFTFLKDHVKTQIDGIILTVTGVIEVVRGVVRLVDAVIHGEWANAWTALKDIASGALDIFFGFIKTQFGNLPEILWNAGYDAIMGLIDGIKNRFNAFKSTLSDIANAIPNTVKSVLGIDSPSRVMHAHGQAIMQGLSTGMQAGFDQYVQPVVAGTMAKLDAWWGHFSGGDQGNLLPRSLWVPGTDSTDPRNWSGEDVGHYIPTYNGRASGGKAYAGQPYIVGERGWEPFVPAVDGRILSHQDAMKAMSGAGGGATTLNIESIVLPGVQNAEQLYTELKRIEQRELRLARAGIRSS